MNKQEFLRKLEGKTELSKESLLILFDCYEYENYEDVLKYLNYWNEYTFDELKQEYSEVIEGMTFSSLDEENERFMELAKEVHEFYELEDGTFLA